MPTPTPPACRTSRSRRRPDVADHHQENQPLATATDTRRPRRRLPSRSRSRRRLGRREPPLYQGQPPRSCPGSNNKKGLPKPTPVSVSKRGSVTGECHRFSREHDSTRKLSLKDGKWAELNEQKLRASLYSPSLILRRSESRRLRCLPSGTCSTLLWDVWEPFRTGTLDVGELPKFATQETKRRCTAISVACSASSCVPTWQGTHTKTVFIIHHQQLSVGADTHSRVSLAFSPLRATTINPLYFYLWGELKQSVYSRQMLNIDDLRERVNNNILRIKLSVDVLEKLRFNFLKRIRACIRANGGHLKDFLNMDKMKILLFRLWSKKG
ncbi:hypothetical protein NQ318_007819 [Aromia moschata]|uniref:Uncharacterized protein n=1 Tax=Aromia moschata TaxID=1265417 RepID=A0AAV8Z2H7_9CUCU|nr:hypothetical protein NQ318_007819 [Aromia moschata]